MALCLQKVFIPVDVPADASDSELEQSQSIVHTQYVQVQHQPCTDIPWSDLQAYMKTLAGTTLREMPQPSVWVQDHGPECMCGVEMSYGTLCRVMQCGHVYHWACIDNLTARTGKRCFECSV